MNRPNWDQYFISIASVVASRSEDPKTKVGAVLVKDNRIVSTGYNGAPAGYPYTEWDTDAKHKTVLHAELNCIVYAGHANSKGSFLYVTHSPCKECAKVLAAAGVSRVVYKDMYKGGEGIDLLNQLGIATAQRSGG